MDGMKKWREAVLHEIAEQGVTQKEIAQKVGIPQSMLSQAMAGKATLKEERRRMVCELLGRDYDEIMGYKAPVEALAIVTDAQTQDTTEDQPGNAAPAGDEPTRGMGALCEYVEGKILEDIGRGGWRPNLCRLRELLDAVCDLREMAEKTK